MGRPLRVMLVDDERLITEGLKKMIDWDGLGLELAGEARNGRDALTLLRGTPCDILITDLKMPVMGGLELAAEAKREYPMIEVLVLTGFDDFEYMRTSIRTGVSDYLLKPVKKTDLEHTLRALTANAARRAPEYPFAEEAKLRRLVLGGDVDGACVLIRELFARWKASRLPEEWVLSVAPKLMLGVAAQTPASPAAQPRTAAEAEEQLYSAVRAAARARGGDGAESSVEKIRRFIEEHYRENVTLRMISDALYFNPSYISRLFKAETGQNYVDFLYEVRIRHAKKLLAETDMSIQQITEAVGFSNAKYFSRSFKLCTGMQPTQYRQAAAREAGR